MKRERLESACVLERERERERGTNRIGRLSLLITPLIKRERWCCEEKYVSDFLVACLWDRKERATPEKKKKESKENGDHTKHKQHNTQKTTKKKKKCFAER